MENNHLTNGWYYSIRGERRGPLPANSILQLYQSGTIRQETLVWTQGFTDWISLSKSGLLHNAVIGPPPVSGNAVNNTMVWWLAFMPILCSVIEYLVAGMIGVGSKSLWFITIVLNIWLCTMDDKKLGSAGYDTKSFGSTWLIPVYLFKRAKYLGPSYSYAIVWCVTFAILLLL